MTRKKKLHARLRANALWNSSELGWTVEQIARNLNRSTRIIYSWLRQYKKKGIAGLYDKQKHRSLTREQIKEMMRVSCWADVKNFKLRWSFRKIADWVKEKWGIKLSPERIRQMIRNRLNNLSDILEDYN